MLLGAIIRWFKKRQAIRVYEGGLRSELVSRYGLHKTYKPAQIDDVARSKGFDMAYICYVYADLLSRTDFEELHRLRGENCDYYGADITRAISAVEMIRADPVVTLVFSLNVGWKL